MASSRSAPPDPAPMGELNTTPLIDVMLVLLVMFIITVPVQSHAVKLDLPGGEPPAQNLEPVRNKVIVTADDRILWNGEEISFSQFRDFLDISLTLPQEPELHLQPAEDARYETVDRVITEARRAGVTKLGIVGNEAFADEF